MRATRRNRGKGMSQDGHLSPGTTIPDPPETTNYVGWGIVGVLGIVVLTRAPAAVLVLGVGLMATRAAFANDCP